MRHGECEGYSLCSVGCCRVQGVKGAGCTVQSTGCKGCRVCKVHGVGCE